MIIEKLTLKHFRNYTDCSLTFNQGLNFIFGNNGNGKTNILEAISMLCLTKSFLQSSESDCLEYGKDSFYLMGKFTNCSFVNSDVTFEYDREPAKKTVKINGEQIGRLTNYFGKIPVVVFSPADLGLIQGTPKDRRRNFDILLSQTSKVYFEQLQTLSRILKQKNSLLRENLFTRRYSRSELIQMLSIWNEELADVCNKIIIRRKQLISEFTPYLVSNYIIVSDLDDEPELEYLTEPDFNKSFEEILLENMDSEIAKGMSLVGPQRDNYIFKIKKSGKQFDLKHFGSQGEQKTFALALKISEYYYIKDKLKETPIGEPILLFDDLFSELDALRTEKLVSVLLDFKQLFITTTDRNYLALISKYFDRNRIGIFYVNDGTAQTVN